MRIRLTAKLRSWVSCCLVFVGILKNHNQQDLRESHHGVLSLSVRLALLVWAPMVIVQPEQTRPRASKVSWPGREYIRATKHKAPEKDRVKRRNIASAARRTFDLSCVDFISSANRSRMWLFDWADPCCIECTRSKITLSQITTKFQHYLHHSSHHFFLSAERVGLLSLMRVRPILDILICFIISISLEVTVRFARCCSADIFSIHSSVRSRFNVSRKTAVWDWTQATLINEMN